MSFRTYHQVTGPDASGIGEQVGAQRDRVRERLAAVRRVVAVMSGKGGVGKSFVTARLAQTLARSSRAVGILDADFNGPTIPTLLGSNHSPLPTPRSGVEPALSAEGVRFVSMAPLLADGRPLEFHGPEGDAYLWRGALEASALREFLGDVAWGELDLLLVDLPPGVQRFLELCDLLPAPPDVLTVTIPTPESRDAVRRALRGAVERGAHPIGIVENMTGEGFAGNAGEELSQEFGVPVLARIPWHPTSAAWLGLVDRLGVSA